MDYEKAYKEARERAKAFLGKGFRGEDLLVECVFPELKESEDERIRKELIQYLKDYPNLPNGQYSRDDFFTYLEKQKSDGGSSEKPNNHKEWSEEDEEMRESIIDYLNSKQVYAHSRANMIVWLKSLRPSWKPSEEQISALERAIVKMHAPNDIGILAELRDILKKLSL